MIYRNQITEPNHLSLNRTLNKQRLQKYHAHLQKISQIQNRIYKPKLQAKIIQDKINQLTKLKEFSRNFKNKQEQFKRTQNDIFMIKNIIQRSRTTFFSNPKQNKSKSTIKFSQKLSPSSHSLTKIKTNQLPQIIKLQNQRLTKSISQNSFDEIKYRKSLRQTTKDYLKIRSHMRRIKDQRQSMKKLKTQPTNLDHKNQFSQEVIQKMNDQEIHQICKKFNKISDSIIQFKQKNKFIQDKNIEMKFQTENKKQNKKQNKNKNLFAVRQSLIRQIQKRLTSK